MPKTNYINEDKYFLVKIPFNADSAISDIDKGKMRLIHLVTSSALIETYPNDDKEIVEKKYGVNFHYEEFNIPQEYLKIKEEEYNNVVFEYLDKTCNCNSRKEIFAELRARLLEKMGRSKKKNKKN